MALVNIPRDRDDPNYRYKMPKLISKIEGRGNGIKTNISNMGEISRALKRPPMYPTKFFGCELGAMAKFEEAEEKALVNGAHKESDLVSILDKFIQMYVLCPGCELPEIDINVKKGLLTCKCNACGYVGSLDNVHKAATYMVRNPPDAASSTMGKKKKSKEERRAEKQQQQREKKDRVSRKGKSLEEDNEDKEEEEGGGDDRNQDNGDDEIGAAGCTSNSSGSHSFADETTTTNGSEAQSMKKSHTERGGDITPPNDEDSESWDEQPQEKVRESRRKDRAREKRSSAASEADKKLLHKEALVFDSPELQDVIDRLRHVVVKNEKVDISSFFQELRMLQVSQDFDSKCRIYVTLGALFKDGLTPESLEKRMAYISKVVDSSVSAADVLDALGHFSYEQGTATLANFPYFLQKLYNAEVLEADDILKYYKKEKAEPLYTACRKHAGPFLQWLREDDDEDEEKSFSSSDEEEEEDEEMDEGKKGGKGRKIKENGGETARGKGQKEKVVKKKDEAKKREEEGKTKKGGGKERTEKDDDNEEEDEEYKTGKDRGEKKSKINGSNNGKKDIVTDLSQTEETGSGGEIPKGKKDDNGQKNEGGGGKRKRKEKK